MPLGRGPQAVKSLRLQATDWVVGDLHLEIPESPVDDEGSPLRPRLPADVTKLGPAQLMLLHGQFTAVAQFADAQLGLVDVDHTEWDHETDVEEAREGLLADGDNAQERRFNLRIRMEKRRYEVLQRRAKKVLLEKLIKGYERAMQTLSRELTRRGIDAE